LSAPSHRLSVPSHRLSAPSHRLSAFSSFVLYGTSKSNCPSVVFKLCCRFLFRLPVMSVLILSKSNCLTSAVAAVYFEKLLKHSTVSIWTR
jgi:hypothetical protein